MWPLGFSLNNIIFKKFNPNLTAKYSKYKFLILNKWDFSSPLLSHLIYCYVFPAYLISIFFYIFILFSSLWIAAHKSLQKKILTNFSAYNIDLLTYSIVVWGIGVEKEGDFVSPRGNFLFSIEIPIQLCVRSLIGLLSQELCENVHCFNSSSVI